MNINEVYLINWLIDEKPVFSLAPPRRVAILHEAAIESLVKKGLLEDAEHFSDNGAMIAKRIADYKSAKKYVKLGDLTFGLMDNSQCILLLRNRVIEDYTFERIDITDIGQLLEAYGFIQEAAESINNTEELCMEESEVKKKFDLGYSNCIYLSTLVISDPVVITNELIFPSEGQLYLYNRSSKCLSKKGLPQIQELIKERMAV